MIGERRHMGTVGWLCAIALVVLPHSAWSAVPLAQIGRGQAPRIDGQLTDAGWTTCAQLFPFIRMEGDGLAEVQTRALVLYDDAALYVGFRCDEPDMSKLVANNSTRDGALWHDDCVEIFLQRTGAAGFCQLIVNTLGTTYEARDEETSWNPKIRAAAFKGKDSWSVEFSVPWSDLGGVPKAGETWRVNFCRERKVKTELSSWSCARGRFVNPASFGQIVFADRAVRANTFELGPQLPGANTARVGIVLPGQMSAKIRVSGAKPVVAGAGATGPIEVVYPLGLSGGDVVFEARAEKRTLWRCAIPVKIQPRPQLAELARSLQATRAFLESLPADSPLGKPVRAAVVRATRAEGVLRDAIQDSLAKNKPLDSKQYRRLNGAVGVEAAHLNVLRWPVWTKNNWTNVGRTELPDTLTDVSQIDVRCLVNEYESANVIISNLSADPLRLRVTASDLTWFAELPATARDAIRNGGFQDDANKDGIPDGWRHISGNRKSWRVLDDPDRGRVVAIDCAMTKKLTIRQDLRVDPDRTYLLDFSAKLERATGSVRVGVINKGWTRSRFCPGLTGTHGWQRIRMPIRLQVSPTHQFVIWARDGGGGKVWLDDIRLVACDDPSVELADTAPELAVADWQELRTGTVVADPLIPLNRAGRLDVPPGESRQIWLTFPARDLPPGHYVGTVRVTPLATVVHRGSPAGKTIRVALDVEPLRLPTHADFAVYNWDYARSEAYVRDLCRHKVNFFLISTGMPCPAFDAAGKALGPIDYAAYDRMLRIKIRYARQAGGQILFSYGVIRGFDRRVAKRHGYEFMDAAWVRAFRHTYTTWLAHLEALGLGYEAFCVQVWDEATGEHTPHVVEGGKLLRQIDPKVRLVMDGAQSVKEVQAMDPYIDVWIPHLRCLLRPKVGPKLLAQYRKTGEPIYTYTCSVNMKSLSAYTYHRLKPWQAARLGLDGVFYWAYNSWRGDPWNDFDGPIADCGAIYDGVDGPITSRRWEASREGIEDWQIMRLFERLARGDPAATARARKQIDEALDTVLTHKDRRELANQCRLELIRAAVDQARSDPLRISGTAETMNGRDLTVTFTTNRPARGKLLYCVIGEKRWQSVEFTEATNHAAKVSLPPLSRAQWVILAWDAAGRVATVCPPAGGK